MILLLLHLSYCLGEVQRSVSDFGQRVSLLPVSNVDDELPAIEPIFGSQNFRINGRNVLIPTEVH